MKKLFTSLLSLFSIVGFSQEFQSQQFIEITGYDINCLGLDTFNVSASYIDSTLHVIEPDTISYMYMGDGSLFGAWYLFTVPSFISVKYKVYAASTCDCYFDTTFAHSITANALFDDYFAIGAVFEEYYFAVPWTQCATNNNELYETPSNLFPNPVQDDLHVSTKLNSGYYRIFSSDGRLIKYALFYSSKFTVDTAELDYGTYLIQVFDENETSTLRFVK